MSNVYKKIRRTSFRLLRSCLRKLGLEISLYPVPEQKRRTRLLDINQIGTIIDVGANAGQYAEEVIRQGFKGQIISFEPVSNVYEVLKKNARKYPNWQAYKMGLGSEDIEAEINIASESESSSFRQLQGAHLEGSAHISYVNKETATIRKLDTIWEECIAVNTRGNIYLKIDTQGFEKDVLLGAEQSLKKIKGVQLEMSLVELYTNEWLYEDVIKFLDQRGLKLKSLETGYFNEETGMLLQMDGIFYRD